MAGKYSIQFHDKAGVEKMSEEVFDNFESLFAYAVEFRRRQTTDAINVHLPSHATDEQRQRIREAGFVSN